MVQVHTEEARDPLKTSVLSGDSQARENIRCHCFAPACHQGGEALSPDCLRTPDRVGDKRPKSEMLSILPPPKATEKQVNVSYFTGDAHWTNAPTGRVDRNWTKSGGKAP